MIAKCCLSKLVIGLLVRNTRKRVLTSYNGEVSRQPGRRDRRELRVFTKDLSQLGKNDKDFLKLLNLNIFGDI